MKKILIILGAVAAITILGLGVYHSDASQQTKLLSEKEITDLISSQYPGEITEMKLNQDSNQSMYEVTIEGDEAEYDLLMDAESGKVLKLKASRLLADSQSSDNDKQEATSKDEQNQSEKKQSEEKGQTNNAKNEPHASKTDQDDSKKPDQTSNNQNDENKTTKKQTEKPAKEKKTAISRDEAIEIALEQFSGKVDDVDLEEENGRLVYEIEIERGDMEAEILIDAYTGEVLVMEIDD